LCPFLDNKVFSFHSPGCPIFPTNAFTVLYCEIAILLPFIDLR
jgi:hypothetical protein